MYSRPKKSENSEDKKYRLDVCELTGLLRRLALDNNPEIKPDSVLEYFPVIHGPTKRKFYLCPMSRDSESNVSNEALSFFWENVLRFTETHTDRNCTLLIPLRQGRPFCKLPPALTPALLLRKHAVLVEVDLSQQKILIHDSQGVIPWTFYPDKIAELLALYNKKLSLNLTYNSYTSYYAYNVQRTSFDCGYFVYLFVKHFFATGSSSGCGKISFSVADRYLHKNSFLQANLGEDAKYYCAIPTETAPLPTSTISRCIILDDYEPVNDKATQDNIKKSLSLSVSTSPLALFQGKTTSVDTNFSSSSKLSKDYSDKFKVT